MEKNQRKNIVLVLILLIVLFFSFEYYKKNDFNDFILSEKNIKTSHFSRDNGIKYSKKRSYRINSPEFNDAMFCEKIKVKKDTPYKISCMVKTKDVISEHKLAGSGAQISVENTTERSIAISGTTDWQQIEMIINSKDREEINIGCRLGGFVDDCIGTAWFSDLKIEEGTREAENSDWKFACFIFSSLEASVGDETINCSLSDQDIIDMEDTIGRFERTVPSISNNLMTAQCDIYKIETPITTLTYDETYGYYVAPESVESMIKKDVDSKDYDYVFIIFKLDDKEVKDWVGLGAMDFYGLGYSNIRLTTKGNNFLYQYNGRINRFPEEVLLHEFLHSLERTLKEYGYDRPALHDNEKYGYKNQLSEGLKRWYADYMTCNIDSANGKIGLNPVVYKLKPAKESEFKNSIILDDAFNEPDNIIEEFFNIIKKAKRNISNMI